MPNEYFKIDCNQHLLIGMLDLKITCYKLIRVLLVKCCDRKKVKSLYDLTIIHVFWSWGGKPTNQKNCTR